MAASYPAAARLLTEGGGYTGTVFVWTKRRGRRARFRFYWWPLVLSLLLSVLLTLALR
jgi:hypothetical protein